MPTLPARKELPMPTVVETVFAVLGASPTRSALGTVYFTFTSWDETPLIVVDWDLKPMQTALPSYVRDVFARLAALRAGLKTIVWPDDIALHVEPHGMGKIAMRDAHNEGYDVREVREDIVELDLKERSAAALLHVYDGKVKIAQPAFDKTVNFNGIDDNHLRQQIGAYKPEQTVDDAELLTAWCTGILQAYPD